MHRQRRALVLQHQPLMGGDEIAQRFARVIHDARISAPLGAAGVADLGPMKADGGEFEGGEDAVDIPERATADQRKGAIAARGQGLQQGPQVPIADHIARLGPYVEQRAIHIEEQRRALKGGQREGGGGRR